MESDCLETSNDLFGSFYTGAQYIHQDNDFLAWSLRQAQATLENRYRKNYAMKSELADLIRRIQDGDAEAYTTVVNRFQDMAVGYAYATLGDLSEAEDVAQEAFIAAYQDIATLREPAAFPRWFRRIVHTQINRVQRRKEPSMTPLEEVRWLATPESDPHALIEKQLLQDAVAEAINALPESQRQVVTLFYMGDYSQQEVGEFLGIPVSTVKMRLYHARKRLQERMIRMIEETYYKQRPSRDTTFQQDVQAMLALVQARPRASDYPGSLSHSHGAFPECQPPEIPLNHKYLAA